MSVLIILRGNSGSGKSSVAKELQKKLGSGTFLIAQDMVRREMLCVHDGKDTLALPLLVRLLEWGKAHCSHVILEGILNAGWYQPLFETAAELFGADIYAYYYDISFEETVKRHKTKRNKNDFGEAQMRLWWKEKDWIGIIPEKILKEDISLEDAVEIIMRDITDLNIVPAEA